MKQDLRDQIKCFCSAAYCVKQVLYNLLMLSFRLKRGLSIWFLMAGTKESELINLPLVTVLMGHFFRPEWREGVFCRDFTLE